MNPVPGDCGYHLHAHQLVVSHPVTNEVSARTLYKIAYHLRMMVSELNSRTVLLKDYCFAAIVSHDFIIY